jgi:hypothetical protein
LESQQHCDPTSFLFFAPWVARTTDAHIRRSHM